MDQGLKYMGAIYLGIFLVVGIFAFSTDNTDQSSIVMDGLGEKTKSAESRESTHQAFNQVKFDGSDQSLFGEVKPDDRSSHRPLNVVKFRSNSHVAFNQVGFALSTSNQAAFDPSDKTKSGETSEHRPLNIVRFDPEPHQAYNVVGFEKKD